MIDRRVALIFLKENTDTDGVDVPSYRIQSGEKK